ncbi:2-dehydro-3-deoxygalactonokinase [Shimia thalassica]|uniref:2-dehydro-3-deoxygalactonokinase n=1 Tax=Shimia thalassica TaxID=1715693 RepID=UPI0026E3E237|nr:2-dehydro-3-deoxygalactonokinase [Shimia thalassica]MDO6798374.1 2-dehydro-3-deoxygalactonokinase [Shimia thalassica]
MSKWIVAERHKGGVSMWEMPSRQEISGAEGPIVMVGGGAAPRSLPCTAIPDRLVSGEGGGWLFPPLAWDGQVSDGAEARVAGFVAANPNWDGVICVMGASTAWVHVSAGEVISFQRFVTAQLAAALDVSDHWDEDRLRAALDEVMTRPERLAAYLARAGDAGTLWGALLGAELAAARPYWLGQQVLLVGAGRGADALALGLSGQGVPVERADDTDMLLAGVAAAVSAHGGL